jgi:hypothetical protein
MPSCAAAAKGRQTNANANANFNAFSSPGGPISGPSGGTLDPARWRVKGLLAAPTNQIIGILRCVAAWLAA